MLERVDERIRMIRAKLDELGLADNTILIFTSDNGGETNVTSNIPLRGGKSELYEGGIRVPMIVCWPGKTPAGSVCQQPTSNVAFYPTLLEAAIIEVGTSQTLDGLSILPTWTDASAPIEREALYWHYPLDQPHFLGGRSSDAIRQGDWKLIEFFDTGEVELYSLAADCSEEQNVAAKHPDTVTAIGDGKEPRWSSGNKVSRWTSRPQEGAPQWIEARFPRARAIRSVGVYWMQDRMAVWFPKQWSLEVEQSGNWKTFELYVTDRYGTRANQYNVVHPAAPLTCDAIRIRMIPQPDKCVGILEVHVAFEDSEPESNTGEEKAK